MFGQVEKLAAVKGEPGGKDVVEKLVAVMAAGSPAAQAALVDAHATLPPESLDKAFIAACRSRSPAEVFATFSPYLLAKLNEKKKTRDPAYAKREALAEILMRTKSNRHYEREEDDAAVRATLDPQWLCLGAQLGGAELV